MGAGDWMEKTYTGLPTHDIVYISFDFWRIDSLDYGDGMKIDIDGTETCTFGHINEYVPTTNLCGGAWGELDPLRIIVIYPSSSSSLKLRFRNNCNQDPLDESTGFRDIKLLFKSGTASTTCIAVGTTIQYTYPCSPGYYYDSGNCYICDTSCDQCYAGGNTGCYACSDGYFFSGTACLPCAANCRTCYSDAVSCTSCLGSYSLYPDNTCQATCISPKILTGGPPYVCKCATGEYLHIDSFQCSGCNSPFKISGVSCLNPCGTGLYYYANATCRVGCPVPFSGVTTYTQLFCNFPCAKTSYYFANGTCSTVCPKYYNIRNISVSAYCDFPCSNPTPYLMDNGTCVSTCDIPFIVVDVIVGLECKYQCNVGEYIYLNRTCKTNCPPPFTVGDKYYTTDTCNFPCAQNQFYYANATCAATCSFPFTSANISVSAYCNFPCTATQFYYQNNTCRSSCTAPFVPISISVSSYCNFQCSSTEFYYSNGSCLTTCPSPFYTSSIPLGKFCNFPCPAGKYYYENGTCLGWCNVPFVVYSITIGDYCNFGCPAGRFYYTNGSCLSTCPSPFISTVDPISRYCDFPCPSGQFYYANKTCRSTCLNPFTIFTISIGSYCNFPCSQTQFYYSNGSCLSSCTSPLVATGISVSSYCNFPCPSGQFYFQNKSCVGSCPVPYQTVTISIGQYCNFPCTSIEYLYQNYTCMTSCAHPFYAQSDGSIGLKCTYLCNLGEFIYSNFTCSSTCSSPFFSVIRPIEKFCLFPCPIVQFLYPDNTCRKSCNSPLVTTNLKVGFMCNFPCPNGEYYYSNKTCSLVCPSPFLVNTIDIGSYCNFPCPRSKYLFENNTCQSTCPSPFTIIDVSVGAYCDFPCKRDEYLFANGTCSSYCYDYPFQAINVSVGGLCIFPCLSKEFFYINNTCQKICNYPLYSVNLSVGSMCYFPCPSGLFYYPNSTCLPTCEPPIYIYEDIKIGNYCYISPQVSKFYTVPFLGDVLKYLILGTMAMGGTSLIAGSDPFLAFSFLFLIQGFFFLLFFNVYYPPIILSILGYFSVARFNFLPNPLGWMVDNIPDLPSPKNFYDNQYTGFFLFTAGPSILIMMTTLFLYAYAILFGKLLRMSKFTRSAGIILKTMTLAFLMRVFASIYSELVYSTLLQAKQIEVSTDLTRASTIIALFLIVFCVIFPFGLGLRIKTAKSYKTLKRYSIIIEDYDINRWEKKYFTFFVYLRKLIHCIAVTILYYTPILQAIIPLGINLVILALLFFYKPHHKSILNFTDSFNELGNFILHTCVLLLAYYDSLEVWDMDKRQTIGWIMLVTITLMLVYNMLLSWFEYFITFYKALQKCRKKKVKVIKKEIVIRYDPSKKYLTKAKPVRNKKLWHFELKKAEKKKVSFEKKREVVYQKKIKIP